MQRLIICALFAVLPAAGCATYWQVQDLEEKVDRLVQNTNRATMNQLFGEQATTITQKMETLSSEEQQKIDTLLSSYEKGATSLEEVRASVLGTMGGNDRVVSNPRGIWVRTEEGKRAQAIGNNTKLKNSQLVSEAELPVMITQNKALAGFRWGARGAQREAGVVSVGADDVGVHQRDRRKYRAPHRARVPENGRR